MPPPMSTNQLAIRDLKQKVKKLTEQLEAKDLYCDSLENDMFSGALKSSRNRNSEYSELMEEITDLHMENKELLEYINRDKKRSKQRKH
jgi:cell division septum initiation protein DivIVA